ncbi:MAG: SDR family NAD(P)-dependent oxidoreductase [Spirochaetales bacterium]|uniref:SDR family NAD(P)-dependent oxidoreductase n=1 Tax=Candidatus Thalassospirochaeta sargassi TaxID=3119039 RepID=A0AAJ1IGA4_9SPIO|nr:SDR family NAD(P)-dependent oxidoreductase [Spirochaetales bacterium]
MSYKSILPIIRGAVRTGETGPLVQAVDAAACDKIDSEVLKLDFGTCKSDREKAVLAFSEITSLRKDGKNEPEFIRIAGEGCLRITPLPVSNRGRMTGRISLVTGGAQGFGEEIVRNLVSEGAFVFIADLNIAKAEQLAEELNNTAGVEVSMGIKVDVSDEDSVKHMVETVAEKSGGLDLFVNNAGVLRAGSVKSLDKRDFDFVTNINYTAYFLCVKHISQLMAKQNLADGRYMSDIVQINSKSGLEGSNKNAAYAGGKFGGIGLTQSFALELMEDNIKVNSICPGNFFEGPLWSDPENGLFVQYLNTGKVPGAKTIKEVKKFYEAKVPMGRGCRGEDVARALYYAVEQKYETGQAIPVTGGQIMLN